MRLSLKNINKKASCNHHAVKNMNSLWHYPRRVNNREAWCVEYYINAYTPCVMNEKVSSKLKHFFHVVSNIRPIVWIGFYICLVPVFAVIYWLLPDGQFRIPDGAGTDFGSWLYYSIVTITTLGFGDYTPAHGMAQTVTAVEVMCGLLFLGFFLNAVGSMKSEIDVESELEKQRLVHEASEKEKLQKSTPAVMHNINLFLAYCYAVTTPEASRKADDARYNPDFTLADMVDLYKPSGLPSDLSHAPAVHGLIKSSQRLALCLDSLQQRVDMSLWPELMDDAFAFVAGYQMFSSADASALHAERQAPEAARIAAALATVKSPDTAGPELKAVVDLYRYIKDNAPIARKIETALSQL